MCLIPKKAKYYFIIGQVYYSNVMNFCDRQPEWAVPHQTKLKYTQIFNTTDRSRNGFLSGAQARNVMVQTKLPQNVLAQIWALSDMDADGRLGCEEFVLAMHLCEQASLGHPPPTKLPLELIPVSFRRSTRTASVSSQGSVSIDQDPASTLLQQSKLFYRSKFVTRYGIDIKILYVILHYLGNLIFC